MRMQETRLWRRKWAAVAVFALAIAAGRGAATPGHPCRRLEMQGEVSAGQEWRFPLGQGWVFRVLPIEPASAEYSGWDLTVDRDPPAGYPDALLLATPPYNSINEREIGTTFGLRAQDAIGWNPRSFRFLTNPQEFRQAQIWLKKLLAGHASSNSEAEKGESTDITRHLLHLENGASSGQLRILDARLAPGVADPLPFAQNWAFAFSRTPHEIEPLAAGQATPRGKLLWMRFALTLWVPEGWRVPPGTKAVRESCPE